jgi:hypothetical protein
MSYELELKRAAARAALVAPLLAAATALSTPSAQALPSYAQQTGQACSACHVGSFGPQLTPFGRSFKLHAYGATASWSGAVKPFVPVSAMVVATYTHTAKDQSAPPANNFGTNNNFAVQEADLFIAGKLAPGLGVFAQATTDTIAHHTVMDNTDIRYAREFTVFGKDGVWGVTLNNSPTLQDVWNTAPAWRFPYVTSALAFGPLDAPMITGTLAHNVVGATSYLWLDNHFYLEGGGYQSISAAALRVLNEDPAQRISGTAPYWRFAYSREFAGMSAELGVFGMSADLEPTRTAGPTDHYDDKGVDAAWQYLGGGKHVFSLNASYINEQRRLDASYALGLSNFPRGKLGQVSLDASYYYDRRWGLTAGLSSTTGSYDNGLYGPAQDFGSLSGKPNTTSWTLEADYTPFGQDGSWGQPWANVRVGLQYTGYARINGGVSNYDGFGRNAGDNNTVTAFVWTAF